MHRQMYHLPLLPGYGPNANIRSSAAPATQKPDTVVAISEAEDNGYLISSLPSSPVTHILPREPFLSASIPDSATDPISPIIHETPASEHPEPEDDGPAKFAEVVFFSYGVVVFFGLEEGQERAILEDVQNAGIMRRPMEEDLWEVEECHFAVCQVHHPA